jgi:hypothetical protein
MRASRKDGGADLSERAEGDDQAALHHDDGPNHARRRAGGREKG